MKRIFTYLMISIIFAFTSIIANAQTENPIKEIQVSHILFPFDEIYDYSIWGMVSLKYEPPPNGKFINIVALDLNDRPVWLLKNIYLHPFDESRTSEEILSLRFLVTQLGYDPYFGMEMLFLAYRVSDDILTTAPVFDLLDYEMYMVLDCPINADGGIFPLDIPFNLQQPAREVFNTNSRITSSFNHGCNVSNVDLHDNDDYGGVNGCAPAAAANSLDWLNKENNDIDFPTDLEQSYENLSNLMNRMSNTGTSFIDMVRAKLDFIEMYDLPITVVFQAFGASTTDSINSTSGKSTAKCQNLKNGVYPNKRWLYNMSKDKCDVELWLKHTGSNKAHVVTVTGGNIIDDSSFHITFKHDVDQDETDEDRVNFWGTTPGTIQEEAKIDEVTAGSYGTELRIRNFRLADGINSDVTVAGVIAECVNPKHSPRPKKVTFKHFCDKEKIVVPPKSTIVFKYPNQDRCFNSTIYTSKYVPDSSRRLNEKKNSIWNWNSNKERSYANNDTVPVFVTIHNDDNKSPRTPSPETLGFDIDFRIESNTSSNIKSGTDILLAETTPSNEEEYGGFSLGWSDNSNAEFGDITLSNFEFNANIGSILSQAPKAMGPSITKKYTIKYNIPKYNKYWTKLDFVLGVSNVALPGQLRVTSLTSGSNQTINITKPDVYIVHLDAIPVNSTSFELTLEIVGSTTFEIDYIGVPSEYQEGQTPSIVTDRIDDTIFCQKDISQVTFQIQNLSDPNYFQEGNEFKAELSDATGSFANPIIIGRVVSKVALPIDITIPELMQGNLYRIRVVSTMPQIVGSDNGQKLEINEIPPKPTISRNGTNLISSADTGNQWFLDGNLITGANQKTYDANNVEGSYSVQVTSQKGCVSEMSEPYKYIIESIDEEKYITQLNIMPNPTDNNFIISYYLEHFSRIEINIVNTLGNQLSILTDENQVSGYYKIQLSSKELNLSSGMYYIMFKIDGISIIRKLFVVE